MGNYYKRMLERIQADERYSKNIDYAVGPPGRQWTLRGHVAELECSLATLQDLADCNQQDKIRLLIHVHDLFLPEVPKLPGADLNSHGVRAAVLLIEQGAEPDIIRMCQWHEEPFGLWKQMKATSRRNAEVQHRLEKLAEEISDWETFLLFHVIDTVNNDQLAWFLHAIWRRVPDEARALGFVAWDQLRMAQRYERSRNGRHT